ncbi:PIG-L deacetylase family protein [Candidatus Margulisiibacteriota bacterium]
MNILAIGAHPDDIEFGCGGTLIRYANAGHNIFIMVMTDGSVGGDPNKRKAEQEEAAKYLNAKKVFWGDYKDTQLMISKELIIKVEAVISEVQPDLVLFNYLEDVHQDHRATAKACLSATRYIKEVLYFEVPTTMNFVPDVFVDVRDVIDKKMELLRSHESQVNRTKVENLAITESSIACATFRGYQARTRYAEGFKALRVLRGIC